MRNKAVRLGIANKVFSINAFITKVSSDYPDLVEYNALNVKKELIGNIDVNDSFLIPLDRLIMGLKNGSPRKATRKHMYVEQIEMRLLAFYI